MNTILRIQHNAHFLWVLVLLNSLPILNTQAQSFTCDVSLNTFRFNNNVAEVKPDFSGKARVTVDCKNAQWVIDYIDNNQKFVCSYHDFILDKPNHTGTNVWYMVSPVVDGYPIDLDFDQRLIWFTYCARDYLRMKQGQPVVLPFGDTRFDCYVHGCRMNAQWHSDRDSCPETATFDYDRDLFHKGVKQLSYEPTGSFLNNRESQFINYIQYHTNGQRIAAFKVTRWASVANMEIPTAWQLDLYWYGQHSFVCIGTAENIEAVEGEIKLPSISTKASITDKRVRNEALALNSVRYTIANGQIPKVDDIKLSKSISNRGFCQMPPDLRIVRIVFIGLFLATGIVPLVFWYIWNKKHQKK
jgi:hypothetical protein